MLLSYFLFAWYYFSMFSMSFIFVLFMLHLLTVCALYMCLCDYVNICMYLVLLCIFGKKLLRACVYCYCWRHTVRKLTPDGHTNIEFWISPEDGPEFGQQPMNSGSKYDADRRSHDGTRTTHEGNTKMWIFIVVYTRMTHDSHTMATRRRIESTMRSN